MKKASPEFQRAGLASFIQQTTSLHTSKKTNYTQRDYKLRFFKGGNTQCVPCEYDMTVGIISAAREAGSNVVGGGKTGVGPQFFDAQVQSGVVFPCPIYCAILRAVIQNDDLKVLKCLAGKSSRQTGKCNLLFHERISIETGGSLIMRGIIPCGTVWYNSPK